MKIETTTKELITISLNVPERAPVDPTCEITLIEVSRIRYPADSENPYPYMDVTIDCWGYEVTAKGKRRANGPFKKLLCLNQFDMITAAAVLRATGSDDIAAYLMKKMRDITVYQCRLRVDDIEMSADQRAKMEVCLQSDVQGVMDQIEIQVGNVAANQGL